MINFYNHIYFQILSKIISQICFQTHFAKKSFQERKEKAIGKSKNNNGKSINLLIHINYRANKPNYELV